MEIPPNHRTYPVEGSGKIQLPAPLPFAEQRDSDWDLRHWLGVLRRRAVVGGGVAIAVTMSIGVWTLLQPRIYEGRFQLLVEAVNDTDQRLEQLTQVVPGSNASRNSGGLDYETQIQVLRSPELMTPIVKTLQERYASINYGAIVSNLSILRLQQTKILEVRYRASDPEAVKWVLDHLSDGYLKYSLQERQTSLRQGILFVDGQLKTLQSRVDKLQEQLQNFRQRNNFIDPETQSQQLATQLSTIAQQKLETQKQLAETEALYSNLQSSGAAPTLRDAAVYQKLLGQLRDIETKIATESSRFSERNPAIQALRDQQRNLLPLLRQEAEQVLGTRLAEIANQLEVLQVRRATIAFTENRLNQQLNELPVLARKYTDLQRELKVASESLDRFLAMRENLQVDAAQKEIPWQLIVVPEKPVFPTMPNVPRNLLMGAIAGALLGILAALLAERLDNTFHSVEELRNQTRLPLLGVIPFNPTMQRQADSEEKNLLSKGLSLLPNTNNVHPYISSSFLESFRSLYTNLRMLSSDTAIRSLVVSSALPSDGKSTVALNLAQAASAMGLRVLLVDADLRRPQVSQLLDLSNMQGLTNLLTTNVEFSQIVQHPGSDLNGASAEASLSILTSGQNPPDPTKLLSSQKMQAWMTKFQSSFDLVIYDTPPLLGLADSSLLAPFTDGMILVVGLGRTDRSAVTQALDKLKTARIPVLGMVANGSQNYISGSYSYYSATYHTRDSSHQAIPTETDLASNSGE